MSLSDHTVRHLKVLHVEDTETDAVLIVRHLRKLGFEVESERVWTEQSFVEALKSFRPDIILSDSTMPLFSGLLALDLARTLAPNTGFVFVSGSLLSSHVETALARGAAAYVSKNNLEPLAAAIERAIKSH